MNTTAPKELGIITVAALFTLIAFFLSLLVLGFTWLASILLGIVVGVVSAVVLWLGWRDPAPGPTGPRDLSPKSKDIPAPSDIAAPAPMPTPTAPAAPAANTATTSAAAESQTPASEDSAPKSAAKSSDAASEAAVDEREPETLSKARAGGADDLKQLKGVGPALETTLNDLGIYHFDQVAGWSDAEIAWVDSRLRFKGRIERDGWVEQAKTLASDAAK